MGDVLACDQAHPSDEVINASAAVLLDQGVLVMPTDSVYGIGVAALPGNPGLPRVFDIKRRDRDQTLPWLVSGKEDLYRFAEKIPVWATMLSDEFWPGALTIVVPASDEVPEEYRRAADGTIALRMPDSRLVRALAASVGMPLAVTSANSHGAPSPASFSELEWRIVAEADLTLDGGNAPFGVASTIVGGMGAAPIVFREGAISSSEIEEVLS